MEKFNFNEYVGIAETCYKQIGGDFNKIIDKVVEFKKKRFPNGLIFDDSSIAMQDAHMKLMNMISRDISHAVCQEVSVPEMCARVITNNIENKIIERYYDEFDPKNDASIEYRKRCDEKELREWYDTNVLPLFFPKLDIFPTMLDEYVENNYQLTC